MIKVYNYLKETYLSIYSYFKDISIRKEERTLFFALLNGITGFSCFIFVDYIYYPDLYYTFLLIRSTIIIPLIIFMFLLKKIPDKYINYIIVGFTTYSGLAISVMVALTNDGFSTPYFTGLILVIFSTTFHYRVPFINFLLSIVFINTSYFISVFLIKTSYNTHDMIHNLFLLAYSSSMALFIGRVLNRLNDKQIKTFKISEDVFQICSHDIKHRLTSTQNLLKTIEEKNSNPILNDTINLAQEETNNAIIFCKNAMNLFFLEEIKTKRTKVKIKSICDAIVNYYQDKFNKKKINFLSSSCKGTIFIDRTFFDLVLHILTNNALMYTKRRGSFTLNIYKEHQYYYFSFCNTGIISNRIRNYLFSREHQFYTNCDYSKGLGLYFSKVIIDKMSGSIEYIPHENNNINEFLIKLPIKAKSVA